MERKLIIKCILVIIKLIIKTKQAVIVFMRPLWKGSVSFGLVNIPIKLYTATENKDIRFNYLHAKCKNPIQYRKYCPHCETEISQEEIVRGFEYEKGHYVIINDDDLENLPTEEGKSISILDFVKLADIDPIYFNKSYFVAPSEGGQKAYHLLKKAMEDTKMVAIAKVVIRTKESLAALRFTQEALIMETMFFPEEIRNAGSLTEIKYDHNLKEDELKMAVDLISSLSGSFEAKKYDNNYRKALMEIIEAKIAGEEVKVADKSDDKKVVDLMDALKASIQLAEKERNKATKKKKTAATPKQKRKTS